MKISPFKFIDVVRILSEKVADTNEVMVEHLAEFLLEPVAKQFWHVFGEVDERSSTKVNAKDNSSNEQ